MLENETKKGIYKIVSDRLKTTNALYGFQGLIGEGTPKGLIVSSFHVFECCEQTRRIPDTEVVSLAKFLGGA